MTLLAVEPANGQPSTVIDGIEDYSYWVAAYRRSWVRSEALWTYENSAMNSDNPEVMPWNLFFDDVECVSGDEIDPLDLPPDTEMSYPAKEWVGNVYPGLMTTHTIRANC